MKDKLGGINEMRGVEDAGYENKVLDLMSKKTSSLGGAHLMGAHLMGEDVQIVAGPKVNAAILGDSNPSAAEIATAAVVVPLAAFAGYGIYKAAGGGSSSSSDSSSKPWLYKLSPSYWTKSDREKRFIRAEKEGGYQNAEKARELEVAKRAYDVTQGVRDKENQLEQYDAGISNPSAPAPGAVASTAPAAPAADAAPTTTSGEDSHTMPGKNMKSDKKILSALAKAGFPVKSGSHWTKDSAPATSALDLVSKTMGQGGDAAKAWLMAFFERQNITFEDSTGKQY